MALTVRSDAGGTFGAVQFNAEDILRVDGAKTYAAPGKTIVANGAAVATVGGSYSINDSGGTPILTVTDTNRFQGDFSNATVSNRLLFQSNVVNGFTSVGIIPNGAGTLGQLALFSNSDLTNNACLIFNASPTEVSLNAVRNGATSFPPLTFYTSSAERMRIHTNGRLAVNTIADLNGQINLLYPRATTHGIVIQPSQDTGNVSVAFLNAAGTAVGSITTTGAATAYNTTSDYRLKENVRAMLAPLSRLLRLGPVQFDWKSDGSEGEGFIAHELQVEVPLAVTGEKDGEEMQQVDNSKLVPLLVAAMQEMAEKIRYLEDLTAVLEVK